MSDGIRYTTTEVVTTTLTVVPTEVYTYVSIGGSTVITTETDVMTLTKTTTLTTVTTRIESETTYAVSFVAPTTTEITTNVDVWSTVETVKTQLIQTTITTEVPTVEWIEETFTYSTVIEQPILSVTTTVYTQERVVTTVVPLDPQTTIETYQTTVSSYVGVGETVITSTSASTTTTLATYSTLTTTTVAATFGYFTAGSVVSLTGVDDYAELWVRKNGGTAICVGTALSNGQPQASFVPGKCSYTIPEDAYYQFSIRNHDNRFNGPSNTGTIDYGDVITVSQTQTVETMTTVTTVRTINTIATTTFTTLTDIYTDTVVERTRVTILPWDDATLTTETTTISLTTTIGTALIAVGTTTTCITVFDTYSTTQLSTTEKEVWTTYEDSTRTLVFTCIGYTTETWYTWINTYWQEIRTKPTYVYSSTKTVISQKTAIRTKTVTTYSSSWSGETLVKLNLNSLTETTTTTVTILHSCIGGVYYGFVPIEETFYNETPCTAIKQGTTYHRHIF